MNNIQKTRDEIIIAYLFLRKHPNIISSESLEFMFDSSNEKLEQLTPIAVGCPKGEQFYCVNKEVGYKDSDCVDQCITCGMREKAQ